MTTTPDTDLVRLIIKAAIAIVFVILGLLAVVIVIGLVQQKLDPTGVVVSLTGLATAIVSGVILRSKGGGGD